jgi:hypothetical protein
VVARHTTRLRTLARRTLEVGPLLGLRRFLANTLLTHGLLDDSERHSVAVPCVSLGLGLCLQTTTHHSRTKASETLLEAVTLARVGRRAEFGLDASDALGQTGEHVVVSEVVIVLAKVVVVFPEVIIVLAKVVVVLAKVVVVFPEVVIVLAKVVIVLTEVVVVLTEVVVVLAKVVVVFPEVVVLSERSAKTSTTLHLLELTRTEVVVVLSEVVVVLTKEVIDLTKQIVCAHVVVLTEVDTRLLHHEVRVGELAAGLVQKRGDLATRGSLDVGALLIEHRPIGQGGIDERHLAPWVR